MARYRKIDTRTWNDQKFNELSDDAKLIFFLLMTHPYLTPLGAMRATIAGLASELGWSIEKFTQGFDECISKGMVKSDNAASFISLPNFLKYNKPESPNVVQSWQQYLDLLPECSLKNDLIQTIENFVSSLSSPFQEALPKVFSKAIANQEQEQKHKQEKKIMSGKPDIDMDYQSQKSQALQILHFLNQKTRRVYRPVDANLKLIIVLFKSGITREQCFQVIAKKTREWKGNPVMEEYLRPATLFNPVKFEQYVGELVEKESDDESKFLS